MGYYVRVLASDAGIPSLAKLRAVVPAKQELIIEEEDEANWTNLLLRHEDGSDIAIIERNPVAAGELGAEELAEFMEDIVGEKPQSAVNWLLEFLPSVKTIYAFQILHGDDVNDGWSGVHALQHAIHRELGGILQADSEGFSNLDGYHILWQFLQDHDAKLPVAVRSSDGSEWLPFEINLANPEHKSAFLEGQVPKGVKRL